MLQDGLITFVLPIAGLLMPCSVLSSDCTALACLIGHFPFIIVAFCFLDLTIMSLYFNLTEMPGPNVAMLSTSTERSIRSHFKHCFSVKHTYLTFTIYFPIIFRERIELVLMGEPAEESLEQ